ncbi:MAG TPA: PilZ domain-containing protein [Candidatus Sulfotelmatobacter sp.]|nr:PilZ domain-containing protein [Candidatus Sulfotelmatobacter sp.]
MSAAIGTDWTRILSDPDLVRNVGKLLQAYREAAPEKREEALLSAMHEIKAGVAAGKPEAEESAVPPPVPTPATPTPPFEPDLYSPNWGSDRRRHPRIKCFVAVELRVDETQTPIWGNLSNTSVGGCLVETASPVRSGAKVEIGLWVPNGKIWVKGFALTGVVTRSGPATGVRVRFGAMVPNERDSLRQFLKFVQETTWTSSNENGYFQFLK